MSQNKQFLQETWKLAAALIVAFAAIAGNFVILTIVAPALVSAPSTVSVVSGFVAVIATLITDFSLLVAAYKVFFLNKPTNKEIS